MSSGMPMERRAAADDFLIKTESLIDRLPNIRQELVAAKLALGLDEFSQTNSADDSGKWQKNELGWFHLDHDADAAENEAFIAQEEANDNKFETAINDRQTQGFREAWETKMVMGTALLKTWLTIDQVIEESYKTDLDLNCHEQPRWQEQPRWKGESESEDNLVWQNRSVRWKDDAEQRVDAIIEATRLQDHSRGHLYKAGNDFKVLEPMQAKEVLRDTSGRVERSRIAAENVARFLFGKASYYEDSAGRREATRRIADVYVAKQQEKSKRAEIKEQIERRNRILGIKEERGA